MDKLKICIGTSNFGKNYGLINKKINILEVKKILNFALKNKIYHLDTAISYNNLKVMSLTGIDLSKFRIDTKISLKNIRDLRILNLKSFLKKILKRYKLNNFQTIYFHNFEDIKKKDGIKLFKQLLEIKKEGLIQAIGISLYNTKEIYYLKKNKINFDTIQHPLNFFDRRFLTKSIQNYLKKNKIKISVRSVFLQGLLLKENKKIPIYFRRWQNYLLKWDKINKTNQNKLNTCLSFIYSIKNIDKVIIGFESLDNLKKVIKFKKVKIPSNFTYVDKNFYLPANWKNKI